MRVLEGHHGSEVPDSPSSGSPAPTFTGSRPSPKFTRASINRVGGEWHARVERLGRTPTDFAEAYENLAELIKEAGIDLDLEDLEPGQLIVSSVDTHKGPGLAISFTCRVKDDPNENVDDKGDGDTK
jgi:hypothetical protein